ncbi:aromatic compound dioxygenase [Bimuria novae-zelandiae CBS 107.79]|uniref:Aromatic compound dioxygenase n=1 Tax=Bimuria novae-zelandiae CBS 107.79 TaxID=1447943 RepID=A0A6A5VVB6_9PLEO|nr:aromatic compound dioxygenase [Bimuria novae-zelandiae CBS 107.79]
MVQISHAVAAAIPATGVFAHPGGNVNKEIMRRQAHLDHPERRTVQSCKRDLIESGWVREQHQRREAKLHELRVAAGFAKPGDLARRDVGEVESEYGANAACTLDPEQTEGPYWVVGELVREDLLTGEKGAVTHLDINVVDTSTCKPVTDAYVEMWGSNATASGSLLGVYTGVQARGNGDGGPSSLVSNALRGLQTTSANGTATFITIIPGHYVGRTNHLHTIVHHGATLLPNKTISGGSISHVGQLYIEQNFLNQVEKTVPYNINTQQVTTNAEDFLFAMGSQGGDDPTLKISLIGDKIEDGLYATIDVGVNPKARQNPVPVNMWTSSGGKPYPNSPWTGYPDTCKYCGGFPPPKERDVAEKE